MSTKGIVGVTEQPLSNLDYKNPLEAYSSQFPRVKLAAETQLFGGSSQPSFFYYLISGTVRLTQTSEDGQLVNLHVFYPGSCISLLSLAGPNDAYEFETLTDVEAFKIPREEFLAETRKNASLTFELLLHAMRGMKGLLHRVEQKTTSSAFQQVAGILSYYAKHEGMTINVTHLEIAEWLGLTRENVSVQLKRLEDEGVVLKKQRQIEITDLDKLHHLSLHPAKPSTR